MTTIPELIRLYIRGLKQLFYYRPSIEGEKGKLSILKIIILTAYIFAYIFAFYQFSESNISEAAIQEYRNNGQYIQIDSNLGIEDNWTISLWIAIDTRGTGVFFSIPHSPKVPGFEYSVNSDQRFQIRNFNTTNDGVVLTGANIVQENLWYCVAATYDGSQVKLYINGTEESSINITGATRTNYNKTFIGSFSDTCTTGENATRGRIVEVRILDHALPAQEIFKDYDDSRTNGSFPRRAGSTVAWYHLNEFTPNTTNIVKDSSSNGNDGKGTTKLSNLNTDSDIWKESLYFEPFNLDIHFPFSIYGQLALLMNFIILIAIIFFLMIGDRPLTIDRVKSFKVEGYVKQKGYAIRDYASRGRSHTVITIAVVLTMISTLLLLVYLYIENIILYGYVGAFFFSMYWIGKSLAMAIWPLISPVLVFGAFLISLDVFAKDYPKLMKGFNFRLVVLFLVCLFLNLAVFAIIYEFFNIAGIFFLGDSFTPFFDIFHVALTSAPTEYANPISVEGLEGVYFYKLGLWWTTSGIVWAVFTMLILIAIEIIISLRRGSNEIQEKRKANLLFIYPFVFIYLISKTIPYIITFGPRLRTLNNLIDLLSLFLIIFLAIFRVLGIQEDPNGHNLEGKDKISLKGRVSTVPPYCKALFVFFLAFASFYISIEANLILALLEVQTISRTVRMLLFPFVISFAISFVFWRYKPFGGKTSSSSNKGEESINNVNKS
jgi:hypothetical protein